MIQFLASCVVIGAVFALVSPVLLCLVEEGES